MLVGPAYGGCFPGSTAVQHPHWAGRWNLAHPRCMNLTTAQRAHLQVHRGGSPSLAPTDTTRNIRCCRESHSHSHSHSLVGSSTLGCRLASSSGLSAVAGWDVVILGGNGLRPPVSSQRTAIRRPHLESGVRLALRPDSAMSRSAPVPWSWRRRRAGLTADARRLVRATRTQHTACDAENGERSGAPRNVEV